ncbi:MAG: sigma-70 family RNA polymerase sigma factor [Planctomycetes bacterium]|nr:sigma-70 family RNA polymerase sigma factor [Planctomycetota bacterium]NUQ33556.1 sigma-70 family RNA polymerase sigma factor [Planctomycetaceae bacterium]
MKTSAELTELVTQARNDSGALEELVQQCHGFVLSLARPRCLDAHAAEDVAQDVWVIVEREIGKLREPKAFLGWLARITEHATTAYLKKRSREMDVKRELGEQSGPMESSPELGSMMDERNVAVLKALRGLPDDYRIPVTMRFYQGLTAREIAETLGCPIGTVLSRLFRANALLKERLRKYL